MLKLAAAVVLAIVTTVALELLAVYVLARNALRSRAPGPLEPVARAASTPNPYGWP